MLSKVFLLAPSVLTPQGTGQEVLSDSVRELPALGVAVRDERVLDRHTGAIRRRTTDAATGEPVDGDALLQREAAARDLVHGKVSHELRGKLQQLAEVEVVFWLRRPLHHPDLRAALDAELARGIEPEDARRRALALAAELMAPLTAPFAEALRAAGHRVTWVDAYVPIVFAVLPSPQVRAWAQRPEVDQAYYAFPTSEPEVLPNDRASPTARTDAVHRRAVTGAGVKVLVQDTAPCATTNPYLPAVVQKNAGTPAAHATAVAGMIASIHSQYRGAAPGLGTIYDAGGSGDTAAPQNWAWGMQQGISFGNCSWWNGSRGSIVFLDRYFDFIIRNFAVMLFKSAGNQGLGQPTTTPGNGYNSTASGCFDDRNTLDWRDDAMASFSSSANPSPGHDKPEVAAPGSNINSTTTASPWVGAAGSGTSYATPVTCGTAALLAATDAALKAKPEVVKAMLMAGAWHNIEGGAALSEQDGAGGIDAAASQAAVAGKRYVSVALTAASFTNGIWSQSIPLVQGDETRIVALWFSEANSAYSTDTLLMDLDLTVEDPSGKLVARSASSLNPFEIVMFSPAVSGTYTVKMTRQRFQGTSEPFALAWTSWQDAAVDTVTVSGTPQVGGAVAFGFHDSYHPGASYLGVLSGAGAPAVLPLTDKRMLPMRYDALAQFGFTLPGFVGALGSDGRATGRLDIPNVAGVRGIEVFYAMVTFDLTFADRVLETSPVQSFKIQ